MQTILVEPLGEAWRVRAPAQELVFKSGRRAEDAARELGERLSRAGGRAEIRIHLRDGSLGGRFICPPTPAGHPHAEAAFAAA